MMHFPTTLDLLPGETLHRQEQPRFTVHSERSGDHYEVWIKDHEKGTWVWFWSWASRGGILGQRRVGLKWRWWQPSSPAERIKRVTEAAQRKADKLNHREMFLAHEVDLGVRDNG